MKKRNFYIAGSALVILSLAFIVLAISGIINLTEFIIFNVKNGEETLEQLGVIIFLLVFDIFSVALFISLSVVSLRGGLNYLLTKKPEEKALIKGISAFILLASVLFMIRYITLYIYYVVESGVSLNDLLINGILFAVTMVASIVTLSLKDKAQRFALAALILLFAIFFIITYCLFYRLMGEFVIAFIAMLLGLLTLLIYPVFLIMDIYRKDKPLEESRDKPEESVNEEGEVEVEVDKSQFDVKTEKSKKGDGYYVDANGKVHINEKFADLPDGEKVLRIFFVILVGLMVVLLILTVTNVMGALAAIISMVVVFIVAMLLFILAIYKQKVRLGLTKKK